MFVGVGAARVRDLFRQAVDKAPCIVFIDEIDAIGKSRNTGQYGGNDEREQTLNQLLSEMDGFDSSKGVIILAATNRPEVLDPALLRPGRFDRRIIVDRPDLSGREAILRVHARGVRMADDVNFLAVARSTSGVSGAELANIINEAAIYAVRNGRKAVRQSDLLYAVDLVLAGAEKKSTVLSDKEKRIVAYHEIGHAIVSLKIGNPQPIQKITIIPRTMGALGFTMSSPQEDRYLLLKDEALDQIKVMLGGRAAEEIKFNNVSSGAANDIERATKLARAMVTRYGMSESFDMMALSTVANPYLGDDMSMQCSPEFAAKVDHEVLSIIRNCHESARAILSENERLMDLLAGVLLERETITGEEFAKIVEDYEKSRHELPPAG
jgi:cell division protease FtsH